MKKHLNILSLAMLMFCCSVAVAGDTWCGWRGDDMSGVSKDDKPPVKWSETENIKWKVELVGDESDSSPIVYKDKIIYQTAVITDQKAAGAKSEDQPQGRPGRRGPRKPENIVEYKVVCRDLNTGKLVWDKKVVEALPHEGHHPDHGFASYTPLTDGKLIWASFGSRGLFCLDMDGNIKWQKELIKMKIRAGFGEGTGLAMAGDKLIVLMDHEGDSKIFAFNKNSGNIVWQKDRSEGTTWTTPLVVEVDGEKQIVVSGHKKVIAYDTDGNEVWTCTGQTENVIPTPVSGFGMVYCTSGFRGSMLQAIKLSGAKGNLDGTNSIAWQAQDGTPYVQSPILYEDKIYVTKVFKNVISCYNAKDGTPYYINQSLDEIKDIYASYVAANGNVYVCGRNGVVYVLKNAEKLEVAAINKLDDGIDASPAIVDDMLIIKGKKNLYCIKDELQ